MRHKEVLRRKIVCMVWVPLAAHRKAIKTNGSSLVDFLCSILWNAPPPSSERCLWDFPLALLTLQSSFAACILFTRASASLLSCFSFSLLGSILWMLGWSKKPLKSSHQPSPSSPPSWYTVTGWGNGMLAAAFRVTWDIDSCFHISNIWEGMNTCRGEILSVWSYPPPRLHCKIFVECAGKLLNRTEVGL